LKASIPDKPSTIDQLGYSTYAKALAKAVRIAETPESSLCVGLYGPWGSGKSTLWNHIFKHLEAEFQMEEAQSLQEKRSGLYETHRNVSAGIKEAADNTFKNARTKVLESPIIDQNIKKVLEGVKVGDRIPIPFGKWCLFRFLHYLCCCRPEVVSENDHDEENIIAADVIVMHRRDKRDALLFSFLVIVSLLTVAPVVIAYVFYKKDALEDLIDKKASVDRVFDLLMGDASVWKGEKDNINLWSALVMMLLWIVQLAVSGIKNIVKTLCCWLGYCFPCDGCWLGCCFACDDSGFAPPDGLPKYALVTFNAWAYSGSDYLWASLISALWDEVERNFSPSRVRLHRAKIELAGESPFRNPREELKSVKIEKREEAWLKYKCKSIASAALSIGTIALIFLITSRTTVSGIMNSSGGDVNNTDVNNTDENNTDVNNTDVIVTWLCASFASSPLLYQLVVFFIKILPYLKQSMGKTLRNKAIAIESSKRKDFSVEKVLLLVY
jgi:hypothetical protein